jgi:hypothetical protein
MQVPDKEDVFPEYKHTQLGADVGAFNPFKTAEDV